VRNGRAVVPLRDRAGPIHETGHDPDGPAGAAAAARNVLACPE